MTLMKGIAGIVYPNVFQVNQSLNPMLRSLQCGSDGRVASHVYKNMEIGACGGPLFCNEKQTIYVALSGFLDNPVEIMRALKEAGYLFSSTLDEEIIAHAYEYWGKDFLKKIRGSFAIALLDQVTETLLLARDSTGKKSLYWYHDQNHFLFSTQVKSLLSTGIIPQTPDSESLAAYFYFGYCPQDMTPIEGVSRLLPGYYLELKRDGSKLVHSYWSYSSFFEKRNVMSTETVTKQLDHLLTRAVEAHLPPAEPVGCFISGGIGSASVAYYLKKLGKPDQVKGFSVGFQGENEQDLNAATDVAGELGISQRRLMLTPKAFLNDYVRLVWYLDEPIADFSVISTWHLAKLASTQTSLVYSGMGSDELFAGHSRYTTAERNTSLSKHVARLVMPQIAHWFAPMLNMVYKPAAYALLKHARANSWHVDYLKHNALFDESLLGRAFPRLKGLFDPELFLNKFYQLQRIKSSTSAFLYFDVKTRMADLYTLQNEKLTSAFDLTWYSPFLNRDVVEFAASLPEPEDLEENDSAKYLKELLKNLLPDSVLKRPKKTRPDFLKNWLNESELPDLFKLLLKGTLVAEGYVSEEWLRYQLSTPELMRKSFHQLWAILALETWFRVFINGAIEEAPPEISLRELLSED